MQIGRSASIVALFSAIAFLTTPSANAQQTLGGITGTVTDTSGAVVSGATVNLIGDQTKLSRTQTTNSSGSYLLLIYLLGIIHFPFHSKVSNRRPSLPYWFRRIAR
jgi:hypothetical protein